MRAAGTVLHVCDRDCGRVTLDGVSLPRIEGSTIPVFQRPDERCLRRDVIVLESALAAVPSGDRLEVAVLAWALMIENVCLVLVLVFLIVRRIDQRRARTHDLGAVALPA